METDSDSSYRSAGDSVAVSGSGVPAHTPGQRYEFEMSEQQFARLLDAARPVPAMWIGGPPPSVQQNANAAWQQLANELGFVWDTVTPVPGKGQRVFSAIAATGAPHAE